jgi:hypothetical protein
LIIIENKEKVMPRAEKNFECLHEDCKKGPAYNRVFSTKQGFTAHFFRKHRQTATDTDFRMTNKMPKKRQYIRVKDIPVSSIQKKKEKIHSERIKGTLKFPIILEIDFDFSSVRIGDEEITPENIRIK